MTDEERQRTMDFILQQQAQFAAGMQKLEGQQAQLSSEVKSVNASVKQLRRVAVMAAGQLRRERTDLRERMAALVDAQVKSEDKASHTEDRLKRIEENHARAEARMTRTEDLAQRTSKDIAALTQAVECHDDDIRALFLINKSNSEDIAALAKIVADMARRRNGDSGAA